MLDGVGWGDEVTRVRRFPGGASLAISAPIDALYAATEVNEWALAAANAVLAGAHGARPLEPARHASARRSRRSAAPASSRCSGRPGRAWRHLPGRRRTSSRWEPARESDLAARRDPRPRRRGLGPGPRRADGAGDRLQRQDDDGPPAHRGADRGGAGRRDVLHRQRQGRRRGARAGRLVRARRRAAGAARPAGRDGRARDGAGRHPAARPRGRRAPMPRS